MKVTFMQSPETRALLAACAASVQAPLPCLENKAPLLLRAFGLDIMPTPQKRPRICVSSFGHAKAYKGKRQKEAEAALDAALALHAPPRPYAGALALRFAAMIPPKKSLGKADRQRLLERGWHMDAPDIDNLAKQLLDAMTRTGFWLDDRQVSELACVKRHGDKPRWLVELWRLA